MEKAAREGGAVLHRYFRTNIHVDEKTNIHDIVTTADKEAQGVIIASIKKSAVTQGLSIGFIGEEGVDEVHGEYIFVIDPLDGTNNFTAQIEYFCVSIGVLRDGQPVAAIVYDVMADKLYAAEKGRGAYLNGAPLHFRSEVMMKDSVVISTLSSRPQQRKLGLDFLGMVFPHVRTIRMYGAVALDLCRMANGAGNIVLNFSCNIWDIAAAILIFQEAGGEVVDWEGLPMVFDTSDVKKKYSILASNRQNLEELIEIYKDLHLQLHRDPQK
jgi:myo-inositol-1(or 4)-monophosphatase